MLLVALLHATLLAIFPFAVSSHRQNTVIEKAVEVSLDAKHKEQWLPPPPVKLEMPRSLDIAPSPFDVIPESQATVFTGAQNGPAKIAGTSNDGQGTRKAPPPPPPAPLCETTVAAYDDLVHSAIERYLRYSQAAQLRGIEGTVTLHFISDPKGQVLVHAVADSKLTRTFSGKISGGSRLPITFYFQRIGPAQWNYQASIGTRSGSIPVGQGTLSADKDGLLHAMDAQAGTVAFHVPAGGTGDIGNSIGDISVEIGKSDDLFILEESATQALDEAQPLPKIPACLNLRGFSALMPFGFAIKKGQ